MASKGATIRVVRPPRVKVPPRVVKSDDFMVVHEGKEYYPHHGEYVAFKGRVSLKTFTTSLKLAAFQDLQASISAGDMDGDTTTELFETMGSIAREVAGLISSWNWTDDDEVPYPNPPSPEDIEALPLDEVLYLVSAGFGGEGQPTATEGED